MRHKIFGTTLLCFLFIGCCSNTMAADSPLEPRDGWYNKGLVSFEFVQGHVDIPPKPGVAIIDSRPATRQYDPGHIPGAINIPDSQFDKTTDRLPADKGAQLIFYCGGIDCMLSHHSAFKAEKSGYTRIAVYAEGFPDWISKGGAVAVSALHIKKLIDEKASYTLVDARPRRVAEKGMIPTAINISDTDFDKRIDQLPTDKATPLIYYCGGLDCVLSDKSAAKAKKLGYTHVFTYPEGYPDWEKRYGVAISTTSKNAQEEAPASTLIPGKEKGTVTVESFQKVWNASPQSLMLVDVRDAREYKAGTIRGAINLPVDDIDDKLNLLPTDKPVVFFCSTGARSGEAYDTVKAARSDVKAYFLDADIKFSSDGSYAMRQK